MFFIYDTTSHKIVISHIINIYIIIVGFGDDLTVILAEAVAGRTTLHGHASNRHVLAELVGVVLAGEDGLVEVLANLGCVDVECSDEFDVTDSIAAEDVVHDARNLLVIRSILVVLDTLHQ